MVGALCTAAGVLKLGFVADLLSRPIRVGYLAGLAVTIVVGQLPKLFGFSVDADGLLAGGRRLPAEPGPDERLTRWPSAWSTWCLIIGLKRMHSRIPGVLAAVVVSIVAVVLFDLTAKGVDVIGSLPQGFPAPSLPLVDLAALPLLFASAAGISLVAIGDTIATSTGFAARRGYQVHAQPGVGGHRLRQLCWPACSRASRSAPAVRAPRSRSSPGRRRS